MHGFSRSVRKPLPDLSVGQRYGQRYGLLLKIKVPCVTKGRLSDGIVTRSILLLDLDLDLASTDR